MRIPVIAFAALSLAFPSTLAGQAVSVSPHFGTLGLGLDASVALSPRIDLRGGVNFQPYSPDPDLSDITFTLDLPSPILTAMLDLHPGEGGFRFSVGAVYFASGLELHATPSEAVDIGDETYTPSEIGTLTGTLVTNSLAPYLGIGFSKASHDGFGFFMDLGVGFHGTPEVELSASGPISSDPDFQAELNQEIADIEDDVSRVKVYPVLSLGFRFAVRS